MLARSLLNLRTVNRVLVRATSFRATSFAQLEARAKKVPWERWVSPGGAVRFRVTCRKSRLYHSDAVAERLAGVLTGGVPGARIVASAVDDDDAALPAQLFVVRMADDVCTISADAAGAPMHKRGYRLAVAKAPLRETLAAAMLLGAEWTGAAALVDPLCGSGTIPIEGALIARHIAPGLSRAFAAESWPCADSAAWRAERGRAAAAVCPAAAAPIEGSDRDEGAIQAATDNARAAGVENDVVFRVAAVSAVRSPAPRGLLATNPPYGVRTGDRATLRDLYARLGRVIRDEFPEWRCAILSADRSRGHELERQLRLPVRPVWRTTNGGIPVRLLVGP